MFSLGGGQLYGLQITGGFVLFALPVAPVTHSTKNKCGEQKKVGGVIFECIAIIMTATEIVLTYVYVFRLITQTMTTTLQ